MRSADTQRLVWDDWNRSHILEHKVSVKAWVQEVEETVASRWVPKETYKGRTQLIGPTSSGRMLSIIVGPVPDQIGAYYVFSARPASRTEGRRHDQEKGGDRT